MLGGATWRIACFQEYGKEDPSRRDVPYPSAASAVMNCRWQVKQMSPSMAHSRKKGGQAGDGGEKKRKKASDFSPERCRVRKTHKKNCFRWRKVGRRWSGWRLPLPPSKMFALLETTDTHTQTGRVRLCLFSISLRLSAVHIFPFNPPLSALAACVLHSAVQKKEKKSPPLISTCVLAACLTQRMKSRSQFTRGEYELLVVMNS